MRDRGRVPTRHPRAVSVGRLRQRLVSVVIGFARSRGSAGPRGAAGEQAQGPPADQGEPVELRGHEQSRSHITLPRHRERNPVEGNGSVPGPEETDRNKEDKSELILLTPQQIDRSIID